MSILLCTGAFGQHINDKIMRSRIASCINGTLHWAHWHLLRMMYVDNKQMPVRLMALLHLHLEMDRYNTYAYHDKLVRIWIRLAEILRDPICLVGACHTSTDEKGCAWPHATRLLIKGILDNLWLYGS